jgi:phenylacetate-CoA ligase
LVVVVLPVEVDAVELPVDADVEPVVVVSGVVVVIVVTVVVDPVVIVLVIVVVAWTLDGAAPASITAAVRPRPMSAVNAIAHLATRLYGRFTGIPPFSWDAYPDRRALTPSRGLHSIARMPMFQPQLEAQPPEEREALQRERLRAQINRLRDATPYWRERLRDVSADTPLESLPCTTKSQLRDQYPFGTLAVPLERTIRIHASSGTRGKPTIVAYTRADIDVFAEVNARAIAAAGGTADDVLHVAYGYGLFTGGLGLHYGGERLGATVVPASGGNTQLQLSLLEDLGAHGLACTPSFALLLAERANNRNINLRYGIFGAEPWSESMRTKLEAAWGIDACDIYGLSEVMGPGVAAECREGKGALHVFDDHFLPEVVDPESDRQTDGLGELFLTTLTKEALPVLRYRTGDVTRFVDGECACGRTHRRIARLSGRVDDMLIVRGVNVFPSEIEDVVLAHPALAGQYVIVLDRRTAMTNLEVRAEASEACDPEPLERELARTLEERLRVRTDVYVVAPGTLPRTEAGKARRLWERFDERDPLQVTDA